MYQTESVALFCNIFVLNTSPPLPSREQYSAAAAAVPSKRIHGWWHDNRTSVTKVTSRMLQFTHTPRNCSDITRVCNSFKHAGYVGNEQYDFYFLCAGQQRCRRPSLNYRHIPAKPLSRIIENAVQQFGLNRNRNWDRRSGSGGFSVFIVHSNNGASWGNVTCSENWTENWRLYGV